MRVDCIFFCRLYFGKWNLIRFLLISGQMYFIINVDLITCPASSTCTFYSLLTGMKRGFWRLIKGYLFLNCFRFLEAGTFILFHLLKISVIGSKKIVFVILSLNIFCFKLRVCGSFQILNGYRYLSFVVVQWGDFLLIRLSKISQKTFTCKRTEKKGIV